MVVMVQHQVSVSNETGWCGPSRFCWERKCWGQDTEKERDRGTSAGDFSGILSCYSESVVGMCWKKVNLASTYFYRCYRLFWHLSIGSIVSSAGLATGSRACGGGYIALRSNKHSLGRVAAASIFRGPLPLLAGYGLLSDVEYTGMHSTLAPGTTCPFLVGRWLTVCLPHWD